MVKSTFYLHFSRFNPNCWCLNPHLQLRLYICWLKPNFHAWIQISYRWIVSLPADLGCSRWGRWSLSWIERCPEVPNLGPEQSRSCEKWFKQVQVYWRNNTCLIKSGKFRTYIYICVTYTYASAIIVYLRRDILSVDGRNHGALYLTFHQTTRTWRDLCLKIEYNSIYIPKISSNHSDVTIKWGSLW